MVQLLLVIVLPHVLKGTIVKGDTDDDVYFKAAEKSHDGILTGVRYLVMLCMYGGFVAVMSSIITIEAKNGQETPPVSPAMQCVMNLTIQYFLVYLTLMIFATLRNLSIADVGENARKTVEACVATVRFAPMLCVLFIGLRLRALQITQQKGSPQGWAQQGMFLATWAILVQLLLVVTMAIVSGEVVSVEDKEEAEGERRVSKKQGGNVYLQGALSAIRYLALLGVYGGAVTCCYAVFVITPETATGKGGLIPGVEIEAPGF